MIKALYSVAASRVIVDQRTNQLSIIDVFEGIKAQSFPIIVPSISFLFHLQRAAEDPRTRELTIRCKVDDTEIVTAPVTVDFQNGSTHRAIVGVEGFIIPRTGDLVVSLFDGERIIATIEAPIEQLELSAPQVRVN